MRQIIFAFLGLAATHAVAGSGHPSLFPDRVIPAYTQECASCHIAYPPALLPAASWQKIMGSLSQHYGVNADMEETQIQEIGQWLQRHAGTYKKVGSEPPDNRISKSDWFIREHRRASRLLWTQPNAKSPAQCLACHTRAEQGRYGDRE